MGRGSYNASDWSKLRVQRNINTQRSAEQLFTRSEVDSIYSSRSVGTRLSCDPEENAKATPIIIGFDVTASMGYLAKELATNSMHNVVTYLLSNEQISSPQILCSAIGDCKSDKNPLQVTQFESDIRIMQQLLSLHIEGGGGGNNGESYNLLWYFGDRHTIHDHYSKRDKKGYLFTIGDDRCHAKLDVDEIAKNFTSRSEYDISNEELLSRVSKRYNVFHIHIEKGIASDASVFAQWQRLLPGNSTVIGIKDVNCLAELIASIIFVTEGMSVNLALKQIDQKKAERIARSMALIQPSVKKNSISF